MKYPAMPRPVPYHLQDTDLSVEGLHLSITLTHPRGNTSNLHLPDDGDLGIVHKSQAAPALRNAEQGRVVIALGVESGHDEVLYDDNGAEGPGGPLLAAIETLQTAREALERVERI